MRLVFIGLFLIFNSLCFSQSIPEIKNEHPRIDVKKERFEWLKNNITTGECAKIFTKFKTYYYDEWLPSSEYYMIGANSNNWNFNWSNNGAHEMAKLTAFLYLIDTDKMAAKRCEFIASKYINFLNGIDFNGFNSHDTQENMFRKNCNQGTLFFDWAYNALSNSTRQNLAKALYRLANSFINNYIINSQSGNSYVSSHNIYNCVVGIRTCLALYNTDGLSAKEQNNVTQWYNALMTKWDKNILPAQKYFRGTDGGWNWGAAYGMMSLYDQYQFFDDIYAATNKNYYNTQSWIKTSINQYWYYFRPSHYTIHFGDAIIPFEFADRVMYRHAAMFKDVRSQYLAQKYGHINNIGNATEALRKLTQYDFSMSKINHPNLPLNWLGKKVGMSVSRTSWNKDATMVWFSCAPKRRADHEHRDNNTFVVIKDKPLIINSGSYDYFGSQHYNNYYSRTIAHNSICVFDKNEKFGIFGSQAANDGGQIESDRLENINDVNLSKYQRGEWLKYVATDNYVYNVADAGKSYNSNKLDKFERRLLYLKPDKIIVLDHLHINGIGSNQRNAKYINHFVNRPNINGNVVKTTVQNKIITYNGHDYTTTNGNGSAAIRTLLPEKSTTTLIGGQGYRFWVNGKNYTTNDFGKDEYHPGSWRIEVEPEETVENQVFLHTIKIGDKSNPAKSGGKLIQNSSTIGVDWENSLYLFSANGKMQSKQYVANSVKGNRNLNVFAFDLKSNTNYGLFVNNQLTQSYTSTNQGVVEFKNTKLSSESNKIEIKESDDSVSDNIKAVDDKIVIDEDKNITQAAENGLLSNDSKNISISKFVINGKTYVAGNTAKITNKGDININAEGSYKFTPAKDFNGYFPDITYTATHNGATTSAIFSIKVKAVNDQPVANNDNIIGNEDKTINAQLLSNDTDVDGDKLKVINFTINGIKHSANNIIDIQAKGKISISADGKLTFTPKTNFYGTLNPISYTISDNSLKHTANISIKILPVNDAPIAVDDYASTNGENKITANSENGILSNDSDNDSENIKVIDFNILGKKYNVDTTIDLAKKGKLLINSDGSYTYTPTSDYNGDILVTYTISDGSLTANATLKITANSNNHAPIAKNDNYNTNEDNPLEVNAANGILSNDTDADNEALKITHWKINGQKHSSNKNITISNIGAIYIATDGAFTFTPNENFNGTLPTITYTVTDKKISTKATITIVVNSVNDKPIANNDFVTLKNNKTFMQVANNGLLSNDTDVDNDQLKIVRFSVNGKSANTGEIITLDKKGEVSINTDGSFSFKAINNFSGNFPIISYDVTDGTTTVTATLNITVKETEQQLVANNDYITTNEDTAIAYGKYNLLKNDSDKNGKQIQIENFTINKVLYSANETANIPNKGNISINADGKLSFTPIKDFNGTLNPISYTVSNGNLKNTAELTIKVLPINDSPIAKNDYAKCNKQKLLSINANNGLLSNDTDIDSENISVTKFSIEGKSYAANSAAKLTNKGILTINSNGSYTYSPSTNYKGEIMVNYTISDGKLQANAKLIITVNIVASKPVAKDDSYSVDEDQQLTVSAEEGLLKNDLDTNNKSLKITHWQLQNKQYKTDTDITIDNIGKVTVNTNGALKFIPNKDFNGNVPNITYKVTDETASATANISLKVNPINDLPNANNDFITIKNNKTFMQVASNGVLSNDTDVDGDELNVTSFSVSGKTVGAGQLITVDQKGELNINADGSYSFTPLNNFSGNFSAITYTITDGKNSTSATLNITVNKTNSQPIANNDFTTITSGENLKTTASNGLLANDTDADGDALSVIKFTINENTYKAGETANLNANCDITIFSDGSYNITNENNTATTFPKITYIISDGYLDASAELLLKNNIQTGIDELSGKDNIKVYPNPSDGNFNISINNENIQEFTVEIYNTIGQKIASFNSLSNYTHISMKEAKSGMYLLLIHYLNKSVTRKLIIQ